MYMRTHTPGVVSLTKKPYFSLRFRSACVWACLLYARTHSRYSLLGKWPYCSGQRDLLTVFLAKESTFVSDLMMRVCVQVWCMCTHTHSLDTLSSLFNERALLLWSFWQKSPILVSDLIVCVCGYVWCTRTHTRSMHCQVSLAKDLYLGGLFGKRALL